MNISAYTNDKTARTCVPAALQRAENLAILGCKNVLELCVGPSLQTLEKTYNQFGIAVTGNDIDGRWKDFYPKGKWLIGDARLIDTTGFDAVVVAPPLSKGCSGKREDALSIDEVFPSYYDFLNLKSSYVVYVLPGKSLSLKADRGQLHKFLSHLSSYDVVPLKDKVTKYVDVYARICNVN